MDADYSDILADPNFPNVREDKNKGWTNWLFGAKSAYIVLTLLVVYIIAIRAWKTFLIWREMSYKLALRRRHGIPDNDHRPFNVAYAAVLLSRQKKEAEARRAKFVEVLDDTTPPAEDLRHRHMPHNVHNTMQNTLPGRFESSDTISYPSASTSGTGRPFAVPRPRPVQEHYTPTPIIRAVKPEVNHSPPKSGSFQRPPRRYTHLPVDEPRKRGFDDDVSDTLDHAKTAGVDGREFVDVDEDAGQQNSHHIPSRGWKRVLGDRNDEDSPQSTQIRDKRQRKTSDEKVPEHLVEEMDVDEEDDEVGELRSSVRGKKRGRKEAGSVLGDDDESVHEAEADDDSPVLRRHRKRRTYAKKKSDGGVPSHVRKRDRDVTGNESDVENNGDVATKNKSKKKRGKKHVSSERDKESDTSMDGGSQASSSREKVKHKIGEEWESNGVKYKIGPNGQRLRQTLIKKSRQKFIMPEDSQHPDRQANFEVYVETWLTEAEYHEAKDQQILAWQDSHKSSTEPQTPPRESKNLPTVTGKDLLWKSTQAAPSSRHATPSSIILVNPFQHPQLSKSGKRIASSPRVSSTVNGYSASPTSPSLFNSINGSPRHRTFSKWEKQELEATAMMKLREANRKKEEEKAQKLKEEKEEAERLKKAQEVTLAPSVLPTVPTITVTKPEEVKTAEPKPSQFSFAPASAGDATKKDSTPASEAQSKVAAKPVAMLSFPPQSQPSSTGNQTNQQPAKPSSPFAFPAPSTSTFPSNTPSNAVTSQPPAASSTSSTSSFSFSHTAQPAEKKEETSASGSGGSLLSRLAPANNVAPQTSAQPAQTQRTFSFGNTTSSAPSNTQQTSTAPAHAQSPFSNKPTAPASNATSQPAQSQSAFSFTKPTTPALNSTPQFSTQSTHNPSTLSFAKPAAPELTKPSPIPGNLNVVQNTSQNAAQATTTQPASTNSASTAATVPKFSFGFGNKPTNAAPTATQSPFANSASSSLSGALGPDMSKAAANAPTFKVPQAPQAANQTNLGFTAGSTTPSTSSTITTPFSFSKPSAPAFSAPSTASSSPNTMLPSNAASSSSTTVTTNPSPFGFGMSGGQAPSSASAFPGATQTSTTAAASPFSTSNSQAPSTTSAFPSAPQTSTNTATSPFGASGGQASSSTSAFPNSNTAGSPFGFSSAFGGGGASNPSGISAPASTAEPPKTFPFGNTSGTATAPKTSEPPKSSPFAFGANTATPSATNLGEAPKPSTFTFGAGLTAPATTFGTTTHQPTSTSSPFTFGGAPGMNPLASSSTTAPSFGDAAKNSSTTQPFGQSAFGKTTTPTSFTFGSSANNSASNNATTAFSAFGKAPAAAGQQQQ